MNLTEPQKLIYDMELFSGGAVSVICGSMLLNGRKDISVLKSAVNELYRINDALRLRMTEADGSVCQEVSEYKERDTEVIYFDDRNSLDAYSNEYAKIPLELFGELCEFKIVILPEHFGILVKLHHLVSDAWTLSLLGTQFNDILEGKPAQSHFYAEYIASEKTYLQSKRYEKDKTFFLEQFKKCDEVTYLSEKQNTTLDTLRKTYVVDVDTASAINSYARQHETSAFIMFATALSVYMSRIKMNAEKFYIGTAVLNRNGVKEKNTVGMFVNTVPLLIELDNKKSFCENADSVAQTALSVFRHQKFNYGEILNCIRSEYGFTEKLYDVLISYQNASIVGNDFETAWYHCGSQNESLQIHIDDRDNEGIFRIHYDYRTDKFDGSEIELLHSRICNILFDALSDSEKKICELEILTDDEKRLLLCDFNNTSRDYDKSICFHQLFEKQARLTPDKTALIYEDKSFTFKQLDEMSNSLAHYLRSSGVEPNTVVPIVSRRHWLLFVAIIAINKAGGAFMCIDPEYPEERIGYMIDEVGAETLLCIDCSVKKNINTVDLLDFDYTSETDALESVNTSDDLTYVIFTSGSTGNPKALMIKHRNAANFCADNDLNVSRKIISEDNSIFLSVTNTIFDMFITECFIPLTNGYTILFANDIQAVQPYALARLCEKYRPDIIETTPTKMEAYLSDRENVGYMKNIKAIILGGEALPEHLLSEIRSVTDAKIYNNYGPAETTVWSTVARIASDDIHIGKPIANTQIYIVDGFLNPTPIGVTGELCIAGDGVGAGYLNRPELTSEKFIANPFGEGRLYKTGDLAYWRADGNIGYVGRNDFQVKIRGLRIELGEIENAVCDIDGIIQATAVVRKNSEGRQLICVFYTGEPTDTKLIRDCVGKRLPKYMVPHICTYIDELPLTSSGKVNRRALPEIALDGFSAAAEYVKPQNNKQSMLCGFIEAVLGVQNVGIEDDFFDLGGDSLKAIEFVSKAHNEGVYFTLQNVFDNPTVRELSECIENEDRQNVSYDGVDFSAVNRILSKNRIDNISVPEEENVGNVLIAGATGYLGIHILANYLDNDIGTAYCLVRGRDKENCRLRLKELLEFYFGGKYCDMSRIEVVCADLTKEKFGLSDGEYDLLVRSVDTAVNAAASVKHYGSYKYFYDVNVQSVKHLIEFCKLSGAKLIHTSTLSVSGNSFADDFGGRSGDSTMEFSECDLYIGQPLDNVYARSKFEAEKEIIEAMDNGLRANIMRMGNLTNRISDGVFQKNYRSNAFLNRLKAVLDLKSFPDYLLDLYVEFTPIDEAADAIMRIVRRFSDEQTVFHINSTKIVYMDRLTELFRKEGFEMNISDGDTFGELLKDNEEILKSLINDMDENSRLNYESGIKIKNGFTERYLANLGFEWSDIDSEYIGKYIGYFRKIGYFV